MNDERCKIGDDELDQLLQVPLENRNAFRRLIRSSVKELWRGFSVQQKPVYRGSIVKGLNGYQEAIAKVKELLGDDGVKEPLEPRAQVRAFLAGIRKAHYADSLDNCLSFLNDLDVALERAKSKSNVEKAYNKNGHRHGAQDGRVAIDLFLYQLIYFTKSCGVKLLTSRKPSAKRNSVHVTKLLTKLNPYLPPEFPSDGLEGACEKFGTKVNAQLKRERAPS